MSDGAPLTRVRPGQDWRPAADDINAFSDAARAHQLNPTPQLGGSRSFGPPPTTTVVTVRNDTGAALERFATAAIGEPLIDPDANPGSHADALAFLAVATVAADHASPPRLLITQEPIAIGRTGLAVIDGASHALITGDEDPLTVGLAEDDDARLTAASTGYDVLWSAPGTGDRLATIRRSGGGGADVSVMYIVGVGENSSGHTDFGFVLAANQPGGEPQNVAWIGAVPAFDIGTPILTLGIQVPGSSWPRTARADAAQGRTGHALPDDARWAGRLRRAVLGPHVTWRHPPLTGLDAVLGAATRETIEDIRLAVQERQTLVNPAYVRLRSGDSFDFGIDNASKLDFHQRNLPDSIPDGSQVFQTLRIEDLNPHDELVGLDAVPLSLAEDIQQADGRLPPFRITGSFQGQLAYVPRNAWWDRGFAISRENDGSSYPKRGTKTERPSPGISDVLASRGVPDGADGRTIRHVTLVVRHNWYTQTPHESQDDRGDRDTSRIPIGTIARGLRQRAERFVRWTGSDWTAAPEALAPTRLKYDPLEGGEQRGYFGYYGVDLRTVLDVEAVSRARELVAGMQWFAMRPGIQTATLRRSVSGNSGPGQSPGASNPTRWFTMGEANAATALDNEHVNTTDAAGARENVGRTPVGDFGGASQASRFVEGYVDGDGNDVQRDEYSGHRFGQSTRHTYRTQESFPGTTFHVFAEPDRFPHPTKPSTREFDFSGLPFAVAEPGRWALVSSTTADPMFDIVIEPGPEPIAPPLLEPPHPHTLPGNRNNSLRPVSGSVAIHLAIDASAPGALRYT